MISTSIIQYGFYEVSVWDSFNHLNKAAQFKGMLFFELTMNLFLMCFALLCLALLVRRKTTFPRAIILYFILSLVFHISDFALYYALGLQSIAPYNNGLSEIFSSIIAVVIWTPYMLKSGRVKGTFVNP